MRNHLSGLAAVIATIALAAAPLAGQNAYAPSEVAALQASAPASSPAAATPAPVGDSAKAAEVIGVWRGSDAMDTRRNNFSLEMRADGRYVVLGYRSLAIGDAAGPALESGRWHIAATTDKWGFEAPTVCVEPTDGHFLPGRCFGVVTSRTQMSWSGTGALDGRPVYLFFREGRS